MINEEAQGSWADFETQDLELRELGDLRAYGNFLAMVLGDHDLADIATVSSPAARQRCWSGRTREQMVDAFRQGGASLWWSTGHPWKNPDPGGVGRARCRPRGRNLTRPENDASAGVGHQRSWAARTAATHRDA